YDNNADHTVAPTRGLVTRTQKFLDTANTFLTSSATYDAWGNLTSETDTAGSPTTYDIDATYHVYITRTTWPPAGTPTAQQTLSTAIGDWDVQCGEKRRETADLNAAMTTYTFDNLCRKTGTTRSGRDSETIDYHDLDIGTGSQRTEVVHPSPAGGFVSRTTFFD